MKLTDKDKQDIISARAVGMSLSEIAEKFTVSKTAISKILKQEKSLRNVQKFTNSADIRKDIISRAEKALSEKDFNELAPETLLKIIERLSLLDAGNISEDKEIKVTLAIEDVSGGEDDKL